MIKLAPVIPRVDAVNNSITVANLKNLKYIKIGKSGLPVEMPLVSTQDRNMAVMLTDSFGFQQAKDAVTIASNYQRDIFVFGKK